MTPDITAALASLLGLVVTIVGWYITASSERKNATQLAVLQASLAKQLQMHKLGSEKEFAILSEVWDSLLDLQVSTTGLTSEFTASELAKPEQECMLERQQKWGNSFTRFSEIFRKNRPFYPSEIYDLLKEIQVKSITRLYLIQKGVLKVGTDTWKIMKSSDEEFSSKVENICEVIRNRLLVNNRDQSPMKPKQ